MNEKIATSEALQNFCTEVFLKMGCSKEHAKLASEVLVCADLRGIDSHGVARLSGYVRLWENGRINANPDFKIVHESPSTAVVDADAALGLVAAPFAMQIAIQKARTAGTGWVAVSNSNHFGIAGYHAMLALSEDMIGMAMTNASALVAPTFSIDRMLGTNPIAVAIPAGSEPPFVADFATTTASNGKLEILQREEAEAPVGWVQDKNGNPSTNAAELKSGGSMLPLGSSRQMGSHKGYALGSIVDIFSAVLSGASYAPFAPPFPSYIPMPPVMFGKGLGHFFGAMRIDAFRPAADFKTHMDNWIQHFRKAKPADSNQLVLIPGDPERALHHQRLREGIPVNNVVLNDLNALAQRLSIDLPIVKN